MKNTNLQVRINEELKQEVADILKDKGLSYTTMLDALFRQIIEERRIPFAIELPAEPNSTTPNTLDSDGHYQQPQASLKASDVIASYNNPDDELDIAFDKLDKNGFLNIRIHPIVKSQVTTVLRELGLTVSQTVGLISKQITFNKNIPSTVQRPFGPDCINADFLTDDERESQMLQAIDEYERGEYITWDTFKEDLKKEGLL